MKLDKLKDGYVVEYVNEIYLVFGKKLHGKMGSINLDIFNEDMVFIDKNRVGFKMKFSIDRVGVFKGLTLLDIHEDDVEWIWERNKGGLK